MTSSVVLNFLNKHSLELTELNVKVLEGIFKDLDYEAFHYTLVPNISSVFSPFRIEGMEKSCVRLLEGLRKNESILIFGDKDTDGMIATAILKDFLENFKKKINSNSVIMFELPEGEDNYGISKDIVEEYRNRVTLIVTVDNGISAKEALKRAKELGIDVIVTDHHELHDEEIFEYAYSVVDPKVKKEKGSYLSGAGVTLMFILGIILYYIKVPELYFLELVGDFVEVSKISVLSPEVNKVHLNDFSKFFYSGKSFLFIDESHFERVISKIPDLGNVMKEFFYLTKIYSLFSKSSKNFHEICEEFGIPELLDISEKVSRVLLSIYLKYDPVVSIMFNKYSPLVGLTVLSDNMPFVYYNKFFIQRAIEGILKTQMSGVSYLISSRIGEKEKISVFELTMRVIPFINSAGRMGQGSKIVKLIISNNLSEIVKLYEDVKRMDEIRKNLVEQWTKEIHNIVREQKVVVSNVIHKGIISLISTKVSNTVDHPVVIISNGGVSKVYSGSARFRKGDIFSMMKLLSSYFENFGGHKKAAGFIISEDKIEDFKKAFEQIDYTQYYDNYAPIAKVDILEFQTKLVKLLGRLEPLNDEFKPMFEDVVVIEDYQKSFYNNYCQVKVKGIWVKTVYTEDEIKKYVGKEVKVIYSYEFVILSSLKEEVFVPKILEIK